MLVYKYMPNDRFFANFKFRFTPAEDLNDPRELVPDIRLRDPNAYAQNIVLRNIESAYWQMQITNPEMDPAQIWSLLLAAADQHMRTFDLDQKAREIFEMFMKVTNRNVGVLSLSEDPLIELMWSHYANGHSGFVVGLDPDSDFFRPQKGEPKVCGELMNVIYTDTTPVVYVEAGKLDIPKEIFFTKATTWSYEKEWRMIKYLPMADEVKSIDGRSIHLFEVPSECVKEIYIGAKTKKEAAEQVIGRARAMAPAASIRHVRFDPKSGFTTAAV